MNFFLAVFFSLTVLAVADSRSRSNRPPQGDLSQRPEHPSQEKPADKKPEVSPSASDDDEDAKKWQAAQNQMMDAEKKRNEAIEEAKSKTHFEKYPNPDYLKAYQDIWDDYAKKEKDILNKVCKDAPSVCPSQADRNASEASNRIAKNVEIIKSEWAGNKATPPEKFDVARERVLKEVKTKCEKADLSGKLDSDKKNDLTAKENKCLQEETDALKKLCAQYTSKEESGCNEAAFQKLTDESAAQMCKLERLFRIDSGVVTGTEVKALREKIVSGGNEEWDKAADPKCDSLLEADAGPVIAAASDDKPSEKPKEEPKRQTASVEPKQEAKIEQKPEAKPAVIVAEGDDKISRYKTSECKWVDDVPRKIVYGPSCGKTPTRICTGYVICPAKDANESTPLFVRQATCRAEYCVDGKAKNCVEDLGYYSRKPSKDEKLFPATELKDFLKARGSHQ